MPQVSIDCFHEHLAPVPLGTAIVAVDVLRATTTAVTAAARGRKLYPARSMEAVARLAADLERPLLAGELGGVKPYGFDLQNSPTEMEAFAENGRPIILLSTSGTRLIVEAASHGQAYVACLRNAAAQAARLAAEQRDVLILGADSRGEFRDEDQLCAARIARELLRNGFTTANGATEALIERLGDAGEDVILAGPSARYLRDTGQHDDLDFVLEHIDDLAEVFVMGDGRIHVG